MSLTVRSNIKAQGNKAPFVDSTDNIYIYIMVGKINIYRE